jgi:hypothetical protein
MPQINSLNNRNGSGMITLAKDELELCGLVDENGDPDTNVQFLITMDEPGAWTVQVLDQDRVTADFQANVEDAPVRVGSGAETRR